MPVTRPDRLFQTGTAPRYQSAWARSSPPVRSDADAHIVMMSERG